VYFIIFPEKQLLAVIFI